MASFTDSKNREWKIELTVGSVNRLATFYQVEPDKVLTEKIAQVMIGGSYIDLAVLFWALLNEQADAHGMDQDRFQEDFTTDDYDKAAEALEAAITAFTRPVQREALAKTLERVREISAEATNQAVEALNDPETVKAVTGMMQREFKTNLSQLAASHGATGPEGS